MKKLLTIITLTLALAFTACEKEGTDNSIRYNDCVKTYQTNYHSAEKLYKEGIIDTITFSDIVLQYRKEYNDCINN